jgi:hypothetical protein
MPSAPSARRPHRTTRSGQSVGCGRRTSRANAAERAGARRRSEAFRRSTIRLSVDAQPSAADQSGRFTASVNSVEDRCASVASSGSSPVRGGPRAGSSFQRRARLSEVPPGSHRTWHSRGIALTETHREAMRRMRAIAAGVGSMMDLGGRATMRTTRVHTRRHRSGIVGDWQVVGDEIREAAKRVATDRETRGRQTAK